MDAAAASFPQEAALPVEKRQVVTPCDDDLAQHTARIVEGLTIAVTAFLGAMRAVVGHGSGRHSGAERWMTTAQAAEYAATTEETIRKWARQGLLVGRDRRGKIEVRASDIDGFLLDGDQRPASGSCARGVHRRVLDILSEDNG